LNETHSLFCDQLKENLDNLLEKIIPLKRNVTRVITISDKLADKIETFERELNSCQQYIAASPKRK